MRVLIVWDDAAEADLISLYLQASENEAVVVLKDSVLTEHLANTTNNWDAVLLATSFGDPDQGLATFLRIRKALPECPVIGACHSEHVLQLASFISSGMRSYVIRDLGGDFVFLLQTTLESTLEAYQAEREQKAAELMRAEIESVRRFQESVIPQQLFCPDGYLIEGRYEPAQIRVLGGQPVNLAGGDYYEVIPLDKRTIVILMGDAAGHGMRACMSIMTMHTLMNMMATRLYQRPEMFVQQINTHFCNQSVNKNDGSLITLIYSVLRTDRNELTWTSAGHPAPLLFDRERNELSEIGNSNQMGLPLGVDPKFRYTRHRLKLPTRARLLYYTDGLVEAHAPNDQSQQFGSSGVAETLQRNLQTAIAETLNQLLRDSHEFTGGLGRHDDTSLLLLERQN